MSKDAKCGCPEGDYKDFGAVREVSGGGVWARIRFRANEDDYRPVKFPPPGPYWCSGYGDGYSIIVAYVPNDNVDIVYEYWPEATQVDILDEYSDIVFSGRFPKPDWWVEVR